MSEKFIINDDLIERDLGDEVVLMKPDGQEIHSLDNTALFIWNQIKEGLSSEMILTSIIEEYKVSDTAAKDDFKIFVEDLKKKEILR